MSNGVQSEIYIDGHKINGVTHFALTQSLSEIPQLELRINVSDIGTDILGPSDDLYQNVKIGKVK